jgi:Zn-finger protein
MTWIKKHKIKHKKLIEKLSDFSDDEIINYFDFNNMVKNEIEFCPLYKDNKKCHDIQELNCYLCACPNFRLSKIKSTCNINSKNGGTIISKNGFIHQDCSKCSIPHTKDYVKAHFNRNWSFIMNKI